jgi:CspA family cold shock protein
VGEDAIGQVKRLQRALGVPMSIELREDAPAIRLGAVDDAVASERIDDRGGKGRSERPAARERTGGSFSERGPRSFERRDRPTGERSFSERAPRPERSFNDRSDRAPRPERSFNDRNERGPRVERNFADRNERGPRVERNFADRNERAPRPERNFNDRNERGPRVERSFDGVATKAANREAVVSFFNDSKGFGFASDDKGDDLFIHFSSIQGDGFKSLSQGQKITFEEAQGPKGREARNVRVVGGGRQRRY